MIHESNGVRGIEISGMEKSIRNYEIIHKLAVDIALRFHRAESELIDILQEIDQKKIFIRMGYSSLFDYATKALKLSEANASNFIAVARKSVTVPELKMAIAAGELTVSKARKLERSHQYLRLNQVPIG